MKIESTSKNKFGQLRLGRQITLIAILFFSFNVMFGQTNIARNKPVTADSYLAPYTANKAVDGNKVNNADRWVSANTSWPHWVVVDLQAEYYVSQVKFWTGYSGYNCSVTAYKIQYWNGTTWIDIVSRTGSNNGIFDESFADVKTNKIRLYGSAGNYYDNHFRLYELEVYGTPDVPKINTGLQIGLSGLCYYGSPVLSNALQIESRLWMKKGEYWARKRAGLYDPNGYPKWLPDTTATYPKGTPLYLQPGTNTTSNNMPIYKGRVCLTWEGDADIRLNGTFVSSSPDAGKSTGKMINGKRYYNYTWNPYGYACEIWEINPANPPKNIKVWMPDPTDPANKSLEGTTSVFHPTFLSKIINSPFSTIRFMDWGNTNVSPVIYWRDRRLPSLLSQTCENFTPRRVPGGNVDIMSGNAGVSYEYMIALCNETNKDMWVCVPHGATNGFVDSLAMLIKGLDPDHTGCTGLKSNLRVFLEYSNEIWTPCSDKVRNGYFTQGCYAEDMKNAYNLTHEPDISREQWIARRF